MKKFFMVILKTISILLALVFIVTSTLALLLFNIGKQAFNPGVYKEALTELNAYETLPAIIGSILSSDFSSSPCSKNPILCEDISIDLRACYQQTLGNERYLMLSSGEEQPTGFEKDAIQSCLDQFGSVFSADTNQMPPYLQNLSARDWERIIQIVLPPAEMKQLCESALDNTFAYMTGDADKIVVSLVSLKNRLIGPAGEDLIKRMILTQPLCTEEEIDILKGKAIPYELILCKPPDDLSDSFTQVYLQQLDAIIADLPDEAVIVRSDPKTFSSSGGNQTESDPRISIRNLRFFLALSPLVPLLFLLIITMLVIRSLKDWMQWWGIPLFVTGTTAIVIGFNMTETMIVLWNRIVLPRLPEFLEPDPISFIRDLLQYLAHALTEYIVFQALIILIIGLCAWIGSNFLKTRNHTREQKPSKHSGH